MTHSRPALLALLALAGIAAGCSSSKNSTGPAPTGSVVGTVTSSLGAELSSIVVVVTPSGGTAMTDTANGSGVYAAVNVPTGHGTVTVPNVPSGCTVPTAAAYANLSAGGIDTVNFVVHCARPVGTLTGKITSSLGGGISGVTVTATPTGASALAGVHTNVSGVYTIPNVPNGGGSIALSTFPTNCTAPAPAAYSGVTTGAIDTVNVTATCVPPNGSLTVAVTAPVGLAPKVTVTGPNGYSHALNATTTLAALPIGTYTVTAADTTIADTIVSSIYLSTVTGSPKTVVNGGSDTVTVSYAPRGGTGRLWLVNAISRTIYGLPASGLRATGTVTPDSVMAPGSPAAMAFDASGNMWVAQAGNCSSPGSLVEYTPAQLALGVAGTPVTTLTSTSIEQTGGMAFDQSGNLWISDNYRNIITEFTVAQLAAGGSQTPAVTISGAGLAGPLGIAFDGNGTLWVGNNTNILGFTSSQLVSVTPTPITITTVGGMATQETYGVAVDANGNLWANAYNSVVEYTPSQLTTSGSPTPTTTVTLSVSTSTYGPAFDNNGNLWLSDFQGSQIVELSAAQLAAGGTPTPQVTIPIANGNAVTSLAFDPHRSMLPLAAKVVKRRR